MDGGEVIDPSWTLKLDKISGSDLDVTPGNATANWDGRFYGTDGTQMPTGIAGKFTGAFNNGEVVGAFGATK